jgi:hypothetical protein
MPFIILFVEIVILGVVFTSVLTLLLKKLLVRGVEVSGPRLVIRRFEVASVEDERGDLIRIEGRATGFVSFVLTKLGIENTVSFLVDRHGASLRGVGLNGKFKHEIPLRCIESTIAAYSQSVWALIFGATVGALSVLRCILYAGASQGAAAAGSIVVGAIFVGCYLVYHHFSKRLLLAVTAGSEKVGVAFQRGVLGSMPIDFALVERASERLDREVLGRGLSTDPIRSAHAAAPPGPSAE